MKKIYLIVSALTVLAASGVGFYVFHSKEKTLEKNQIESETKNNSTQKENLPQKNSSEQQSQNEIVPDNQTQEEIRNWDNFIPPAILPADCDQNCRKFTDSREKSYCWKVCELPEEENENPVKDASCEDEDTPYDNPEDDSPDQENLSSQQVDCEKLQSIERDTCLRNKAIAEKNFNTCDQISDSQIRRTCKNRITEEILNAQ